MKNTIGSKKYSHEKKTPLNAPFTFYEAFSDVMLKKEKCLILSIFRFPVINAYKILKESHSQALDCWLCSKGGSGWLKSHIP